MISGLYKQLKNIADSEYEEIVIDPEIILGNSGRPRKLRVNLVDNTFIDIWYFSEGEYSLHWEQSSRNTVFRHDNAPHKKWAYC